MLLRVKTVVQVKLLPSPVQAAALQETLHTVNEAANCASRLAYQHQVTEKTALQRLTYTQLKADYGLSAQPAIHVIRKVAGAYASLAANPKSGSYGKSGSRRRVRTEGRPVTFRPTATQPYDDRCLSWQMDMRTVSIWTTRGRLRGIPITGSDEQFATIARYRRGESDLLHRDGKWFLLATCEVPEAPPNNSPSDWLGVDLGVANIATTSDPGASFTGKELSNYRTRSRRIRTELQ
jgi:putative transposase